MGKPKTQEILLDGLGCASCAAKMEKAIKNLNGVNEVSINFSTRKLVLESDEAIDNKELIIDIKNIVERIEPHVKVILKSEEKHDHLHDEFNEKINKKELGMLLFGVATFFTAILFKFNNNVEIALYIISYILIGREIIISAFRNILKGELLDENFLMSVASLSAFAIKEYPEAVAVMLFYKVGEYFEANAVNKSRESIEALLDIRPDFANLKVGNETKKVLPDEVNVGDIIIVKVGEKIPLDGVVIGGESMVDTSVITGESVPRKVYEGIDVYSGGINQTSLLTIKVLKPFKDSTVSKILELVEKASNKKAKTEKLITKFANIYTPVVVGAAVLLAVIPPLVIEGAVFSDWIYRAAIFLVISCPCALVISIPLGYFGGIGAASKNGILVKGGNYLEALNKLDTIVLDKTGTLTKGVFEVNSAWAVNSKEQLVEYAAYAEKYSNHPIAKSIFNYYGKEIDESKIDKHEELSGQGVKVVINGVEVLAGNAKLMAVNNIKIENQETIGTIVHVAVDGNYEGYLLISDEIKEDSKEGMKSLRKHGIKRVVMLTGDTKIVAEQVAKELGITEVFSELLPHEKVDKIEEIQKENNSKNTIAFVGDGINDAPVLARADIGIAMGGLGSDAAIEAADIVLMTDEISKLSTSIQIANRTRTIVWQNIIFALGVKAVVLVLGAFGLASMWAAVFADVGVAVLAILNSMRVTK